MPENPNKPGALPDSAPDLSECIVIGRFAAPYGVRGWLNITAFGGREDSFIENRAWWCAPDSEDLLKGNWRWLAADEIRRIRGGGIAAKLHGIDDREAAMEWRGGGIALPRELLPQPPEGEYYWYDLIGLSAVNEEGVTLGRIGGLMRTGAHDILRIVPEDGKDEKQNGEILVPFIDQYVLDVDIDGGAVRLHWPADWL